MSKDSIQAGHNMVHRRRLVSLPQPAITMPSIGFFPRTEHQVMPYFSQAPSLLSVGWKTALSCTIQFNFSNFSAAFEKGESSQYEGSFSLLVSPLEDDNTIL
jgi:hypothetical protein